MCSHPFMFITAVSVDGELYAFINYYIVLLILLFENSLIFLGNHVNGKLYIISFKLRLYNFHMNESN